MGVALVLATAVATFVWFPINVGSEARAQEMVTDTTATPAPPLSNESLRAAVRSELMHGGGKVDVRAVIEAAANN